VLLRKPMESRAHVHAAFVLYEWLGLDGGPGQSFEVAQLEAAAAIDVILQVALGELKVEGE
jgi:hypothetical protein